MPIGTLETATVRITVDNTVTGSGFLIKDHYVLTCTHVIQEAIDNDLDISVCFIQLDGQKQITCKVVDFLPLSDDNYLSDIAVLAITNPNELPEDASPISFRTDSETLYHPYRALGFPDSFTEIGVTSTGEIRNNQHRGLIQLEHRDGSALTIRGGNSGGAVWDETLQAAVGMIVIRMQQEVDVAYAIPMRYIEEVWHEKFDLPPLSNSFTENPYKGLNFFTEADVGRFYGREDDIASIQNHIEAKKFLAVVGNSGIGKSSVVFAGLVPKLRDTGRWVIVDTRPGERAFENLADVLAPYLLADPLDRAKKRGSISKDLENQSLSLSRVAQTICEEQHKESLLLVIDQFEELFTSTKDADKECQEAIKKSYIDMLLAAQVSDSPINIVITIRTDFLSFCQERSDFGELIDTNQHTLQVLDKAEKLRPIIELPVGGRPRVQFEAGLIETILADANTELPLLQFALQQLWERTQGAVITHKDYEAIGKVEGALADYAKEVYAEFQSRGLEKEFRQVMMRLVNIDSDVRDARRIIERPQFAEQWNLVTELASKRLLRTGSRDSEGEQLETTEVIHEALIRNWPDLKSWVADERPFLRWEQDLNQQMQRWKSAKLEKEALLSGSSLSLAETYLEHPELKSGFKTFIEQSQAFTLQKQRQRRRNQIVLTVLTILSLLTAGGAAYFANDSNKQKRLVETSLEQVQQESNRAHNAEKNLAQASSTVEVERDRAVEAEADAFSRQKQATALRLGAQAVLAAQQPSTANGYPDMAMLLATEAVLINRDAKGAEPTANNNLFTTLMNPAALNGYLRGHQGTVYSLAYSPDGLTLASGSGDDTIILWDTNTGQQKSVLSGHQGNVSSLAYSPDGLTLASGSEDDTVILWDSSTGQQKSVLSGHQGNVSSLAYSPDGLTLASGSWDDTVILWDASTGQQKSVLNGHQTSVFSIAYSSDGLTLASGDGGGTVILWDASTGQQKSVLSGHQVNVSSLAYSPDGLTLASGSLDRTVILWDASTGQQKSVLSDHQGTVDSLAYSPDGLTLASGNSKATVILWDASTGQQKSVLSGHQNNLFQGNVYSLAYSPDGLTLASGSLDDTVILWNANTGQQKSVLNGHQAAVFSIAYSSDGLTFASGSGDDTIILWDTNTGQQKSVLSGHQGNVSSLAYSPDGLTLASGSWDDTVILWDASTGQQKSVLNGHQTSVFSIAYSSDGLTLASGDGGGTVILWDASTGQQKSVLSGHQVNVSSLAYSPDGLTLASGSLDRTVILWDASTGQQKSVLSDHQGTVDSLAYSPDGLTLASGSADNTIILWDTSTGQQKSVLSGHQSIVSSLAYSPDELTLASGSWDDTIILWDASTGEQKSVLSSHQVIVYSLAYSPDGLTLVSGGGDGTIILWDPIIDNWLKQACERAGRNLKEAEWTRYIGEDTPYELTCTQEKVGKDFNYPTGLGR